ncbi:hypothetical protein [Mucilaginibacter paludis]|uniref:O-antigen polymerase n=1 Tax=Mucilaginibacter paludis DSM 18603 TaxID=714943 RepID=H1YG97_9SPHI|nr:hypothetical protein [Mucilaginibacter paludis]EHQ27361.1 hypothetical protein Mucpa_3257 [Mucilaginibacter paludis DSM 18603]
MELNSNTIFFKLKKHVATVDWKLLAFLILFLNVKIGVKIFAIVLIYLLEFDFKFGFKFKKSTLPLFYPIIIGIAVINRVISINNNQLNYNLVFFTGVIFWLLCILALHQIKLAVNRNEPGVIHRTVLVFFALNAAVSIFNLLSIIMEIHTVNPYLYQGQYQKYFIGTGDYIRGLTFDISTTNAVINAFGVIYFLVKKHAPMALLCMAVLLLTGSNAVDLMLMAILLLLFIFKTSKDQKSLIVVCILFWVVFILKVSPQNNEYVLKLYAKAFHHELPAKPVVSIPARPVTGSLDNSQDPEAQKRKIAQLYLDSLYRLTIKNKTSTITTTAAPVEDKHFIPGPDIDSKPFQHVDTSTSESLTLLNFISAHKANLPFSKNKDQQETLPGKLIAIAQTEHFLKTHPQKLLTGDGVGNFSSKTAFRATGLGFAGKYPPRFAYISGDFLTGHLDIYLNFFSRADGLHSLVNSPNSVYDQLLGEYGLIGLGAFLIYYLGYFLRDYKKLTYGIPLLMMMAGAFLLEYWFEQLSVVVLFELLLLVNMKEASSLKTEDNGNQ